MTDAVAVLERLALATVVDPAAVDIEAKSGECSTVISATSKTECGNLIGRKGRAVRSMQLLARLAGEKCGRSLSYTVQTPPGDNPPSTLRDPIASAAKWDASACHALLKEVLAATLVNRARVALLEMRYNSTFEVALDADEPVPHAEIHITDGETERPTTKRVLNGDAALQYALTVVFGAIGKLHGRVVDVTVVRPAGVPEEPQPATAAGRYAKPLE